MKIVLASKSPRRKEILENIFKNLTITNPSFKEKFKKNQIPENVCMDIAQKKGLSVSDHFPYSYIISADTIVFANNEILGKPNNKSQANKYLKLLSNNSHEVYTGVSLINKDKNINELFFDQTEVFFNKISNKEISFYINNHNPFDKAGSYGIQDWSKVFIKKINGCFYNVVGFPLPKFYKLFANDLRLIK